METQETTPQTELEQTPETEPAQTPTDEETTPETEETEADSFPREYVEKLRKENATYRERAKETDRLAQELHTAKVAAIGKLHDPTDLAYDPEHLANPEALTAAVDDLLARKPHLATRTPHGDIGQGVQTSNPHTADLAAMLRNGAA